uniref:amino acid--tRNA ligase-related protein n=1 Tax=Mycoplasmopsis bovis TaxID=28903 RepID=UPI003D2B7D83
QYHNVVEHHNQKLLKINQILIMVVPPHCGIAFGLDRLIMLLAHQKSIRDVIPFPKNSKNQDLLMDAPSDVTMEQLDELGLVLKDE